MNDNELFTFKRNFEDHFGFRRIEFVTDTDRYEYFEGSFHQKDRMVRGDKDNPFVYTIDFDTRIDVQHRRIVTKAINIYGNIPYHMKYKTPGFFGDNFYYPPQQVDYNPEVNLLEVDLNEIDLNYWIKDFHELFDEALNNFSIQIELIDEKDKWKPRVFDIYEFNY